MAELGMVFDPTTVEPSMYKGGDFIPLSLEETTENFRTAMIDAGISTPPDDIIGDGQMHSFSTNGKANDDAGRYVFHSDGVVPAGWFCDHRTGVDQKWSADVGIKPGTPEHEVHLKRMEEIKRYQEQEKQKKYARAQQKALSVWEAASREVSPDNRYLVKKQIQALSLREMHVDQLSSLIGYTPQGKGEYLQDLILIAPIESNGKLRSLEFIDEYERKSALAGGKKGGCYWLPKELPKGDGAGITILIGEGVATVLSAMEATGAFGVAVLSSGNFQKIVPLFKEAYPAATIVALADIGGGQSKAEDTAKANGVRLAVPDFGENRTKKQTDFNDLAVSHSPDTVKQQIEAVCSQTGAEQPNTWPAPDMRLVNSYSKAPPKVNTGIFPKPLDHWLPAAAEEQNAPVDFVAANLLSTSASLIGMARSASPWKGWVEPTIIRNGDIGGPSSGKTPSKRPLIKAVLKIEAELRELWKIDHDKWKNEKAIHAKDQIAFDVPEPPEPRLIVVKGTPQKFETILEVNPKGLHIVRDELSGLIGGMGEHSGAKDADRGFYLEGYNGDPSSTDTITRGTTLIPHNATSIMGGIQPDKLHTALLTGDDDGFAARLIFIWANPPSPKIPELSCDHDLIENAFRLLAGLGREKGGYKVEEGFEKIVPLSKEAREFFDPWWKDHVLAVQALDCGFFTSAKGKWQGTVLRLATILEFLRWAVSEIPLEAEPAEISEWATTTAIYLVEEWIEPHYKHVLAEAGATKTEMGAKLLAKELLIRKPDIINSREIYRTWKLIGLKSAEALDPVLDELVDAKWLNRIDQDQKQRPKGGRPPHNYKVNPRVFS